MKKLAVAFLLAITGVNLAVPASALPGAWAGASQMAEADWIVKHGPGDVRFYFAAAMRSAAPEGVSTYGVVGKGECSVNRDEHGWMMICHASGRGHQLSLEQFEFDPALRSARMQLRADGFDNVIRWKSGSRLPWAGQAVVAGDGFVGAAVAASRGARASGRVLGRNVVKGSGRTLMKFGYLSQGADAYAFGGAERTLEIAPDGSYRYRIEVRIPRPGASLRR